MLQPVFADLDRWLTNENSRRAADGDPTLGRCDIRVLGQVALLEARVSLHLVATQDVDAYIKGEYPIQQKLDEILNRHGKHLDTDSSLIWMPKETQYDLIYDGKSVKGWVACADYVLVSKALKAPGKNKALIQEYLAKGASPVFMELAGKYRLDLEQFL